MSSTRDLAQRDLDLARPRSRRAGRRSPGRACRPAPDRGKSWRSPLTSVSSSELALQPYSECMSKMRLTAWLALMTPHRMQPGEKALARAGLAEDTVRALARSRRRSDAHRHVHVDRLADAGSARRRRAPKTRSKSSAVASETLREVGRNGARRPRRQVLLGEYVADERRIGQHELRLELDRAVGGGAAQHLAQQRVGVRWRGRAGRAARRRWSRRAGRR